MKKEAREQARQLRAQGHSVREICKMLGVAKSSVSLWVRDIPLTEEQIAVLKTHHSGYAGQHAGSQALIRKHRALRQQYQEEGRAKAREKDPLHIAGCMLYWGEGAKSRNLLKMVNSDPDLLIFFMKFLRESLSVNDEEIRIRITCYLNNGISLDQIESYWLEKLKVLRSSMGKSIVNVQPISSQQKGRKLLYGTCAITVSNTRLLHHIYGAIQEYSGVDKPQWLM